MMQSAHFILSTLSVTFFGHQLWIAIARGEVIAPFHRARRKAEPMVFYLTVCLSGVAFAVGASIVAKLISPADVFAG